MEIIECNIIHETSVKSIKEKLLKEETYNLTANFFKLLSDTTRVKIMWALDKKELCVCDLAAVCMMSKSAISHQLALLKEKNIVKNRREGKEVFYSLKDDHIKFILENCINHIIEKEETNGKRAKN